MFFVVVKKYCKVFKFLFPLKGWSIVKDIDRLFFVEILKSFFFVVEGCNLSSNSCGKVLADWNYFQMSECDLVLVD